MKKKISKASYKIVGIFGYIKFQLLKSTWRGSLMKVCVRFGFSFDAHQFQSIFSPEKADGFIKRELQFEMYYDNAERNYSCFNQIQICRIKRIIHKHTKIAL